MFNWFKSKVELKKDSSIMSSSHSSKGFKLGTEIIVPTDFECLVFHKEKLYNTLKEGKYKLDKDTFDKLINSQNNRKKSKKHINCVYHYINLSKQKLQIYHKKKTYEVEFEICDSFKFATLILLHSYKVNNEYVVEFLNDMFCELLSYIKSDVSQIKNNSLQQYGINITSFLLTNTTNKSIFNKKEKTTESIFDKDLPSHSNNNDINIENIQPPTNEIKVENVPQINKVKENKSNTTNNPFTCPKCGNTSKFDTTYCLKCGYKLK